MKIAALYIYPVKSCRGISVTRATIDALGCVGDRRFLIVDETGKLVTQRTIPQLALIGTHLSESALTLTFQDKSPIAVPLPSAGAPFRTVEVWSSKNLQSEDCGAHASEWLSEIVGQRVFLVRAGQGFHRPLKPEKAQPGDVVSFADAYPFLILTQASLDDLNDRLAAREQEPVPINRFRPNIVISGTAAYAEDTWRKIRINDVVFRAGGDCARCIVTTTDQDSGKRGKEPLRTLASYRRGAEDRTEVVFGQNFIQETKKGVINVGDEVVVL